MRGATTAAYGGPRAAGADRVSGQAGGRGAGWASPRRQASCSGRASCGSPPFIPGLRPSIVVQRRVCSLRSEATQPTSAFPPAVPPLPAPGEGDLHLGPWEAGERQRLELPLALPLTGVPPTLPARPTSRAPTPAPAPPRPRPPRLGASPRRRHHAVLTRRAPHRPGSPLAAPAPRGVYVEATHLLRQPGERGPAREHGLAGDVPTLV